MTNEQKLSIDAQAFLSTFFGENNDIRVDGLSPLDAESAIGRYVQDELRIFAAGNEAVVLPCLRPGSANTQWYGLAGSSRQARALRDQLVAFVGPSYSDFTGQMARLDESDPIENAIARTFGRSVFRFGIPPCHAETVVAALTERRRLLDERPSGGGVYMRATGRVLRDYELALTAGDVQAAESALSELERDGHLNAQNIVFLKVRLCAQKHDWPTVLATLARPDVQHLRYPRRVAELFVRALYADQLARFEAAPDPEGALTCFKDNVLPGNAGLFRSHAAMQSADALKAFMLYTAQSQKPNRIETRDVLLARVPPTSPDRPYLEQLAALVPPAEPPDSDPLVRARRAYDTSDFDASFVALLEASPSVERLRLILMCAYEIDTNEAVGAAYELFESASDEDRTKALASRVVKTAWEELEHRYTVGMGALPADWIEWLERLDDQEIWAGALEAAERGASEWRIDSIAGDSRRAKRLATLLSQDRHGDTADCLRDALPHLISSLMPEGQADPRLRAVYQALLMNLLLDERVGDSSFSAIQLLVVGLFELGLDPADYASLVTDITSYWEQNPGSAHFDWALDLLDTVIAHPCPNEALRAKFFYSLHSEFVRSARRLESHQMLLYRQLCDDLSTPDAYESVVGARRQAGEARDTIPSGGVFSPAIRHIAIYTLTESVGLRVRSLIKAALPDCRVDLSTAHVGSDQLRSMAEAADVFVVATRSAKHAATEFIDAHRPAGKPTLRPSGRGSSSMLREIYDFIYT